MPLPEPFDYAVPEGMDLRVGSYVTAPLGQTERLGVVWELLGDESVAGRTLKPVLSVYDVPPMRDAMREFISWGAKYTVSHPGHVLGMTLRARGGLSPSPTETVFHLTGDVPGKLTDARRRVLDVAEEVGAVNAATLAAAAGVSSGVVKGLEKVGALRAEEMAADLPFALPQPDLPGATLTGEQAEAAEVMKAVNAHGWLCGFPARWRDGLGQDGSVFRGDCGSAARGP